LLPYNAHSGAACFCAFSSRTGPYRFINLAQAAEIAILSEQECQIKFVDGGVVSVETKSEVDEVLYLIGAKARPPVSRQPLQQDQTK
jgi:hypothetical protein